MPLPQDEAESDTAVVSAKMKWVCGFEYQEDGAPKVQHNINNSADEYESQSANDDYSNEIELDKN